MVPYDRFTVVLDACTLFRSDDLEVEVLFGALDRPEHVANLLSLKLTADRY